MVTVLEVLAVLAPVLLPRALWGRAQQRRLSSLVLPGGTQQPS
jgi:hypothetical protein